MLISEWFQAGSTDISPLENFLDRIDILALNLVAFISPVRIFSAAKIAPLPWLEPRRELPGPSISVVAIVAVAVVPRLVVLLLLLFLGSDHPGVLGTVHQKLLKPGDEGVRSPGLPQSEVI